MPRETKTCGYCGAVFQKFVSASRWTTTNYCSVKCRHADVRQKASLPRKVCSVSGCMTAVRSSGADMCEKHYGQVRRNGHIGPKSRPVVIIHSAGYLRLQAPLHALAPTVSDSYRVYDHRAAFYEAHGVGPFKCHWCEKVVGWDTVVIARLNGDPADNRLENLIPTCRPHRARATANNPRPKRSTKVTWNGTERPMTEWAALVGLPARLIARRIAAGWSVDAAMTAPLGTHVIARSDKGIPRPHRRKPPKQFNDGDSA